MDAKTYLNILYNGSRREHRAVTNEIKKDIITRLPKLSGLLPTANAINLFEHAFNGLLIEIEELQKVEIDTHPVARAWDAFAVSYANIDTMLHIAESTTNRQERDECLMRAILFAIHAKDEMELNIALQRLDHKAWEDQEEYLNHIFVAMPNKIEIEALKLFKRKSQQLVEESGALNPVRGETLFGTVAMITDVVCKALKKTISLAEDLGIESEEEFTMDILAAFKEKMNQMANRLKDDKLYFGKTWEKLPLSKFENSDWAMETRKNIVDKICKINDIFFLSAEISQSYDESAILSFGELYPVWKQAEYKETMAESIELCRDKMVLSKCPVTMVNVMNDIGGTGFAVLNIPHSVCKNVEKKLKKVFHEKKVREERKRKVFGAVR